MESKKIYRNELLAGAFILGILYSFINVADYAFGVIGGRWLFFIYGISVIAFTQIRFGRRVAASRRADIGFGYGKALGFVVLMSMLSGVIVGIVEYFIQNVIDPEYGEAIFKQAWQQLSSMIPSATEQELTDAVSITKSIWAMIFGGIFMCAINGLFVGFFSSVFVKRDPDLFTKTDE